MQCVKYRRAVFVDYRYVEFLKTWIHSISQTFGVEVTNIECSRGGITARRRAKTGNQADGGDVTTPSSRRWSGNRATSSKISNTR
ncbi:MAG: hypothetical protein GX191_10475 [Candidatus Methanoculleus thermohydrogenotrophicum]|nr:hypothetical protein [Candidatus Methanoculleus thermohydrogenotrophicum]